MPKLLVCPEHGKAYPFVLPAGRTTIGRAAGNDLILNDACCSGRHAVIVPTGSGGLVLQDLNSKNGTHVNDERVFERVELRHGDEIQVGSTVLRVDLEPARSELTKTDTVTPQSGTVIRVADILAGMPTPLPPGPARSGAAIPAGAGSFADILDEVNQTLIYADLDFGRYLDRIMDVIAERIPMDRAILKLKDEATGKIDDRVTRLARHPGAAAGLPVSGSIIRTAVGEKSAILIPDTRADPRWRASESIIQAHIHSAMCVPLYDQNEITGVIYADRLSRRDAPFQPSDLTLLTFLANLVAGKIRENRQQKKIEEARRIDNEIAQARRYQQILLPKGDPDFAPYEVSGRAVTSPTIGGDYFDYIPLDRSHLGIVIADVSGTGVGASMLMFLLSGSLQTEVQTTKDLGDLSARLSDVIYQRSESNTFISFFMGILDRDTGELRYVNAGHNYPLLVDPGGKVKPLVSTGMCLGMLPCEAFETGAVTLGSGDLLCLFTDGIVECRNPGREEFGEDRLVETLRGSLRLPARRVVDRVYEAVEAFSPGAEPDDDMTVVVLKRSAA